LDPALWGTLPAAPLLALDDLDELSDLDALGMPAVQVAATTWSTLLLAKELDQPSAFGLGHT
jgi:hypothetical protein